MFIQGIIFLLFELLCVDLLHNHHHHHKPSTALKRVRNLFVEITSPIDRRVVERRNSHAWKVIPYSKSQFSSSCMHVSHYNHTAPATYTLFFMLATRYLRCFHSQQHQNQLLLKIRSVYSIDECLWYLYGLSRKKSRLN